MATVRPVRPTLRPVRHALVPSATPLSLPPRPCPVRHGSSRPLRFCPCRHAAIQSATLRSRPPRPRAVRNASVPAATLLSSSPRFVPSATPCAAVCCGCCSPLPASFPVPPLCLSAPEPAGCVCYKYALVRRSSRAGAPGMSDYRHSSRPYFSRCGVSWMWRTRRPHHILTTELCIYTQNKHTSQLTDRGSVGK